MRTKSYLWALLIVGFFIGCGDRGPKPPTVAELTQMLQKDDAKGQIEAAHWVMQLGPKALETKPALIGALKSSHVQVRQDAAIALGKLGPDAADSVPALTTALNDAEIGVRRAAAEALSQFGPAAASAIPALENMSRQPDPCKAADAALKKIRT